MESRRAYNLYLPTRLHAELQRLIDAGLPASAVARLAVRKWSGGDLPAGRIGGVVFNVFVLHPVTLPVTTDFAIGAGEVASRRKLFNRTADRHQRFHF